MITSGLEKINHFADCVSSILISESACSFFFNFGFGNSWFGKKKGGEKSFSKSEGLLHARHSLSAGDRGHLLY